MTKAEFLQDIVIDYRDLFSEPTLYDYAYKAQFVTDDEELVELARTCVISTEDFQDYLEESYDALKDTSNTI